MNRQKINLMPVIGSILLILLYISSLRFRGFMAEREYMTALFFREFYPELSGTFLPKLPAALSTLSTGALLWLAARRYCLLHPGIAPGLYLCFPPVWWLGTSAALEPLFALAVTLCAAGIFIARREKHLKWRIPGFIAGVAGAIGTAWLIRSGCFNAPGILLALLPAGFFLLTIRLEKLDFNNLAAKRLNTLAIFLAVLYLAALGLLLTPQICRFIKVSPPEFLNWLSTGKLLYRPALALLAPLLWLYLVREAKKCEDKITVILIAVGFTMLALPPSMPWQNYTNVLQYHRLIQLKRELGSDLPQFFADINTAPALRYTYNVKVTETGWAKDELPPDLLKRSVENTLKTSNAAVVFDGGELDMFIPRRNNTRYTLNKNCQMFLYKGDKK